MLLFINAALFEENPAQFPYSNKKEESASTLLEWLLESIHQEEIPVTDEQDDLLDEFRSLGKRSERFRQAGFTLLTSDFLFICPTALIQFINPFQGIKKSFLLQNSSHAFNQIIACLYRFTLF
ncbi:MAG TPA: hypothetical protein PKC24_14160 [Cyclobacteriaceae bacterium]|nr:hypothetical protein [Cyclobacteriaceae bacterium]